MEAWVSVRTMPVPEGIGRSAPPRAALWEHARNSLGIARLLVHEARPEALVATACWSAVEHACRAALGPGSAPFDGDLARAFSVLSAPPQLLDELELSLGPGRLAAAEKAIAWLAGYLRAEVPERAWGF